MLDEYKNVQPLLYNYARRIKEKNKISHAYLIETNGVEYGFDIALALLKYFLCEKNYCNNDNCKDCNVCTNIDNKNYPDIKIIETDAKTIKKEQMLDLQKDFSTKPLYGKYLIYIIKNAELLNKSSANTILKFLEEPSDDIIAILITNNIYNLYDTIISRCQILNLKNEDSLINKEIFKKYCENEDTEEFIKKETNEIIEFYQKIENDKEKVLYKNNIYEYSNKIDLLLEIGMKFYIEILNNKIDIKLNNFIEKEDIILEISKNNTINGIINKINVISEFIEKSKTNANKDLLLDNFLITFLGGNNE